MDKLRGITAKVVIFLIILSTLITYTIGDGGEKEQNLNKQRPNAAERAIGITNSIRPWDKVRSWIKIAWMNSIPPNSVTEKVSSAGEVVKEAVAKSIGSSKETAEHTAKVAGEVVHKTAEKAKESVSSSGGRHMVQDL